MIPIQSQIDTAINIILDGGIVIFPTDTAFGIGCRIDKSESIERLFLIRRRPLTQATPVLVVDSEMALRYFSHPTADVLYLMRTYWPGALTIISECDTDQVNNLVRGGGHTIGLRMPNNDAALSIISGVRVPILGPSANFHGKPTPYSFESIDPDLRKLVDYVVEGSCSVGLASTVVDCTKNPYTILRQGGVILG